MTIERALGATSLAALAWAVVLAGGPLLGVPSPALRALGAAPDLTLRLPAGVSVVEAGGAGIVLRGTNARELYRLGARFVVPSGLPTCVARPSS